MSKRRIDVFVSSTIEDLKPYRDAVRDEILKFPDCRPIMMEYFPAMDANAVKKCMDGVDEAEIYLGIYAYRYGFCPKGSKISITEMEFDRATANGIPRLCFLVEPKFPWNPDHIEDKSGKTKLNKFKKRIDANLVRATFTTPDSLAKAVAHALRDALDKMPVAETETTTLPCDRVPKPPLFAGRVKELAALKETLEKRQTIAITTAVRGVGGIGKTTLAQQVASDLGDTFGLKLWAALGQEFKEERVPEILRSWTGGDFPQGMSVDQMIALTKNALTDVDCGNGVLALIDDVWPGSVGSAKLLRRALPEGTCVLVTTRTIDVARALNIQSAPLDTLPPEEGAALLITVLESLGIPQAREHEPKLRSLSDTLEGHPLALRLVAYWLARNFNGRNLEKRTAEIEAAMQRGTDFAGVKLDAGDEKENSVSVTLKLTYERLGWDEDKGEIDADKQTRRQKQFRALGALPADEPFSHTYLMALVADTDAIDDFAAEGLLTPEEGRDDWYSQHRLLRAYARGLARDKGELDAAFGRYADAVIEIAEQFDTLPPEEWGLLEGDLPHVTAVGDALVEMVKAASDDADLQVRVSNFANNITRYLFRRREVRRLEWVEMGLTASRVRGEQRREALFYGELGSYHDNSGKKLQAIFYYEQALALARTLGDQKNEASLLNNIGAVWADLGEKRKALDYYEQALPLRRALGDRGGEATTLNNIGAVWDGLGEKRKALDYYEQALSLRQAVGDRGGEATTLNNIGAVWSALGEKRKALDYYEQALPLRQAVGDRGGEAVTLNNIGAVWDGLGEKRKALDYYEQALSLRQAVGDRGGEATTLNNIGMVWDALGAQQKALDYYEQALPLHRAVGDRGGEAVTLSNIGKVWDALGAQQKALDYYGQALSLRQAVGDRGGEATTLNNIGKVWADLGEKRKALDYFEQALPLLRVVGERRVEAVTLNNIAVIHFSAGELEKAAEIFEQIVVVFQAVGAVAQEAAVRFNLAIVLQRLNRMDEAIAQVRLSITFLKKYDLPQTAFGTTLARLEAFLRELEGKA